MRNQMWFIVLDDSLVFIGPFNSYQEAIGHRATQEAFNDSYSFTGIVDENIALMLERSAKCQTLLMSPSDDIASLKRVDEKRKETFFGNN